MTDFKAKMHQIRNRLGLCAGKQEGKWEGKRGRGEWSGEGKGGPPKLLLNQGPSQPCYATA